MIYIVCALKSEAVPLIKKYDLKRAQEEKNFSIYKNENIQLVISGIGKLKSAAATAYLLKNSDKNDFAFNIGVCAGGQKISKIGELFVAARILDNASNKLYFCNTNFNHNLKSSMLTTYDLPQFSPKNGLCDMEASGFFVSALNFLHNKNIFVLKAVSDHFSEEEFKKDEVCNLIEQNINGISDFIAHNIQLSSNL